MPTYVAQCPVCGPQDTWDRMSTSAFVECPVCRGIRPKGVVLFQHQEDRIHMWKGPLGNGYSTALGAPMPGSRAERDRMAKAKGVEFVGRSEFLAENKEAAEAVAYKAHVDSGGERLEQPSADTAPAFKAKPDWAKALGI